MFLIIDTAKIQHFSKRKRILVKKVFFTRLVEQVPFLAVIQ